MIKRKELYNLLKNKTDEDLIHLARLSILNSTEFVKDAETLGKNARLIRTYSLFTMSIDEEGKAIICLVLYFIRKLKNIHKIERLEIINEDEITELEKSLVDFLMNHKVKYLFGLE